MRYTKNQLAAAINFYKDHLRNPAPEMRNILLLLAQDAFDSNELENAVLLQSQVLCNAFDCKNIFEANSIDLYSDDFMADVILPKSAKKTQKPNALLKFAKENFQTDKIATCKRDYEQDFDVKKSLIETKRQIKEMPDQWTILQLVRGFNENMSLQTREDNLTTNLPIYLSVLKHARSSIDDTFVCLKLEFKDAEIYHKFFEIQEMFKSFSGKEEQHKNVLCFSIENTIINVIKLLEKEFGPWSCLFSGNLLNEEIKQDIFQTVDNFCSKYGLNNHIRMILSLLLCEPVKLTTSNNYQTVSRHLSKGLKKSLSTVIEDFLKKTAESLMDANTLKKMQSKGPCLLIIDEVLDHFAWEFINKCQEFCRISSLNVLNKLFLKHKSQIANGYLRVSVKRGHFFVNPENNLQKTEDRIRGFGKYWLPAFEYTYGEKPSGDKIRKIFNSSDIYVYCGHGHGMDYLNPHKLGLTEINNPVAFLFGCESVKLTSKTSYGEMSGEHLYFHKGLCPAVVGCIHIAFDYSLDLIATEILSSWIVSKQKTHWNNIDKEEWRRGKVIAKKLSAKSDRNEYDPKLAAILSKIRSKGAQKYYHLTPLVFRGIPIWNTDVNNT